MNEQKRLRAARLAGKVALVTGADPGLGGVIAEAMAIEGAHLVLCDIDQGALQHPQSRFEAQGAQCLALRCDVSDSAAVDAMFAQAVQRFGTVDILRQQCRARAQCARRGGTAQPAPTVRDDADAAPVAGHRVFAVRRRLAQVVGSQHARRFLLHRAAVRLMEPRRSGKIINIASIAGLSAGSTHSPGYSATKAGVISLTKISALDVAGANIYVNAIACGGILTPPLEDYPARASEEQRNRVNQLIPLGRVGRPEEYASLAVYLASDEHYLVGQVISPNGGMII